MYLPLAGIPELRNGLIIWDHKTGKVGGGLRNNNCIAQNAALFVSLL